MNEIPSLLQLPLKIQQSKFVRICRFEGLSQTDQVYSLDFDWFDFAHVVNWDFFQFWQILFPDYLSFRRLVPKHIKCKIAYANKHYKVYIIYMHI